ncbi:MAG: hypothetical protein KAW46_11805, partial [candidate division Zixibacteria bacterium]|nr:hypothetical protein [candidate division Zixibacteria bacterium]
ADGFVTYPGGLRLIGEGGPVEVGSGKVTIGQSGEIRSDGVIVARIVPATVADINQLEKIGNSLYAVPEGIELIVVERFDIRQGYIETSNVDIVREMIDMMISFRAYEANSRAIQAQDQSLDQLFSRVGGKQ